MGRSVARYSVGHVFRPIVLSAFNPSPMTGEGNNTYLVVERGGSAVLIDGGVGDPRHLAEIDRQLEEHHARLDDVLVTHGHPDHASGCAALAKRHPEARFRKRPWPGEDARYLVPWIALGDGDELRAGGQRLIVVATPGHSPDHVAFWHEESRDAFTGDLVVAGTTVVIAASRGGDLHQYLLSLERVRALAPRRLLPAHGPQISEPSAVLDSYVEHRRQRERQVIEAVGAGLQTVQTITDRIYRGLSMSLMPAARENVRAHLEKLRREGRAAVDQDRWHLR